MTKILHPSVVFCRQIGEAFWGKKFLKFLKKMAACAKRTAGEIDGQSVEKRRRITPTFVRELHPAKNAIYIMRKPTKTTPPAIFAAYLLKEPAIPITELVVRPSEQEPDPQFHGKELGLGVFMPDEKGGCTVDFVADGEHVLHIRADEMANWQKDYAIMDLFNDDMVFVPRTREIKNIMFRIQHSADATHLLLQSKPGAPRMVRLTETNAKQELTVNYGLAEIYQDEMQAFAMGRGKKLRPESPMPKDLSESIVLGSQDTVASLLNSQNSIGYSQSSVDDANKDSADNTTGSKVDITTHTHSLFVHSTFNCISCVHRKLYSWWHLPSPQPHRRTQA